MPGEVVMNWGLFEKFCEMLESIPTKAVLRAVEAERKMVEDDLAKKRTERDEEVASVLGFCNFLMLAMYGMNGSIASLPEEHRAFYSKILHQLLDAGELPSEPVTYFDRIILPAFEISRISANLNQLTANGEQQQFY
jgi:hypothetical protein